MGLWRGSSICRKSKIHFFCIIACVRLDYEFKSLKIQFLLVMICRYIDRFIEWKFVEWKITACVSVLLAFTLFAPKSLGDWHRFDFKVMGTSAAVELWDESYNTAAAVANQIESEMRRIERIMSPYIPDSQLSAINRLPKETQIFISAEIFYVLQTAQNIAKASNGVFDISFATVGFLYDYREGGRPSLEQLDAALPSVDYRSIVIESRIAEVNENKKYSLTFLRDGMKLDLGGIAKGYAVDRGVEILLKLSLIHI